MTDLNLNLDDLIDNPTPRIPICLVLDTSDSMNVLVSYDKKEFARKTIIEHKEIDGENPVNGKTRLDELNEGLKTFFGAVLSDDIAIDSAEIAMISFASKADVILDFNTLSEDMCDIEIPSTTGDETSLGTALEKALDMLEIRKETYKNAGVDYYQPWIVLLTDGAPTDDSHKKVSYKIKGLMEEKRISFFPIGIGKDADFSEVDKLSKKKAIRLDQTKFKELFEFLGKSVSVVSRSMPGDGKSAKLDEDDFKTWLEL